MLTSYPRLALRAGLLVAAACTVSAPQASDPVVLPTPVVAPTVPVPEPVAAPAPVLVAKPVRSELLGLAEARVRFKARDYAGAWQLIEPIARAVQSDGGLQCEAGYLAHHAGHAGAKDLLLRGIAALNSDSTRPGRKRRAMCLYNLALVQAAGGALGEAICSLRRSEALRPNATVKRKREELAAQVGATDFRCKSARVARQRDVRALAGEYAAAEKLKITSVERVDAGEFVVHTVHLDPGERDPEDIDVFADLQYVVLDREGQLFPLGVLGYTDETPTYFRGGGSFSFAGFHPSPLGTLVLFSLSSWGRGDCEHVVSSNGIAAQDRSNLLMCRYVAGPEGGELECAQVPLGASEEADAEEFEAGVDGGSDSGGAEARVTEWGARVTYTLDEAAGVVVFEQQRGDEETAAALGLPLGRLTVAELFAEHATEDFGFEL